MDFKLGRSLIKSALSLSLAAGSLVGPSPVFAGGVDGVEFQPVPININNRCSAIILKGTNRFKGVAFKMPRVMLSVDKNYEDVFEIIPKGNGQYTMRFALYFPLKDDAIEIRRERSNLMLNTCSDELILAELNDLEARSSGRKPEFPTKTIYSQGRKYEVPDESKIPTSEPFIHSLSPLPVSAIDIAIDGFPNMTKTIGFPENNLLGYQNTDLVAEFLIPDEQTYEEVKAHLTGRIGLSVAIKMSFSARSSNGRVNIDLDTRNIAMNLEAAAAAKIGLGGGQQGGGTQPAPGPAPLPSDPLQPAPFPGGSTLPAPGPGGFNPLGMISSIANLPVGEGELRAYLASAIARSNMNIQTEQGDDENFNRLAYQVIERIAAAIPALPQVPQQAYDPNSNNIYNPIGGYNPLFPGTGGQYQPGGSLMNPPPPSVSVPGPSLKVPEQRDQNYFYLGAVVNYLKQQQRISLNWENLGRRETQSYTTNVIVRGDIPDPGYKTLNVVAGDTSGSSYTNFIKAGETIVVKIPSKRELVTSFQRRVQYYSRDEIRRQGFAQHFGNLQEAIANNKLEETIDRENGGYVAIYRKNQDMNWIGRWWQETWHGADMTPWNYYWGLAELRRVSTMNAPMDLDIAQKDLNRMPMKVTFSEMGTRFNLSQLSEETASWSGRFEDNQIVLTAKRDLGHMNIRNYEQFDNPARTAEKYLFEIKEPLLDKNNKTPDGKSLSELRQFSWVKYANDPTSTIERVSRPNLEPFKFIKSVYVVMVKVKGVGREEIRSDISLPPGEGSPIIETSPNP